MRRSAIGGDVDLAGATGPWELWGVAREHHCLGFGAHNVRVVRSCPLIDRLSEGRRIVLFCYFYSPEPDLESKK